MHPRLIATPFLTIYTFGLLLASAYVAAFWWLTRHPVQLYESIVCAVLFVLLLRLRRCIQFDGEVILSDTLLYAVARFILELFRGDADRGFVFGGFLSTSQFIALMLAPVGIGLWVARRRRMLGC